MPTGGRRKREETITGTWESPGMMEDSQEVQEEEVAPAEVRTADFVRLNTMVGKYYAGSVLPATAFEELSNLLKLGAVEYDYTATEQSLAGTESDRAILASIERPVALTVPQAPWVNGSAANLMGAKYIPFRPSQRVEIPQEPTIKVVTDEVNQF